MSANKRRHNGFTVGGALPGDSDGTCAHLNYRSLQVAAQLVKTMQMPMYASARKNSNAICVDCGFVGDFGDTEYLAHYCAETHHWLAVRWVEPLELYCFYCGDFQYSAFFDSLICKNTEDLEEFDRHFFGPVCEPCSPSQPSAERSMGGSGAAPLCTGSGGAGQDYWQPVACSPDLAFPPECASTGESGRKRKSIDGASGDNESFNVTTSSDSTSDSDGTVTAKEGSSGSVSSTTAAFDPAEAAQFQAQLLSQLTNPRSVAGITNLGSTCFMNSVLQAIMHNSAIFSSTSNLFKVNTRCSRRNANLEFLTSEDRQLLNIDRHSIEENISNGCIACDLREIIVSAADAGEYNTRLLSSKVVSKLSTAGCGGQTLLPSNLLFSVWSHAKHMAGYDQQDAHEFLIALLDGIGAHLESSHGEGAGVSSGSGSSDTLPRGAPVEQSDRRGFVSEVFAGHLLSNLICRKCDHRSFKREAFLDISLSLQDISSADGSAKHARNSVLLSDCLRQFTAQEALSELIMCTKCLSPQPAFKQLQLGGLPRVLIVHLKRFDAIRKTKLGTNVNFELRDFDVSPFCGGGGAGDSKLYDLQALVSHRGSLNQGHYIAYVSVAAAGCGEDLNYKRNYSASGGSHVWLRCDDELITVVDDKEVEKAEAYLLFYVNRSCGSSDVSHLNY